MRVLVIGGTGFVSGAIARHLHARGHQVIAYHRGRTSSTAPIDHVCSPDAAIPVTRFPADVAPDVVVHAVAVGDADARAVVAAFPSARIVALSSGDVYQAYGAVLGRENAPPPGPISEDSPLRAVEYPYGYEADSPWGVLRGYEKLHVERAVLASRGTVLRLGKVYGPGDDAVTPWLRALKILPPGESLCLARARWRWTHVYVDDVALATSLAVEGKESAGRVYNVGEGHTPTQLERFEQLARAAGIVAPVEPALEETLPDLVLDSSRIRRELGFVETPPDRALGIVAATKHH